MAFNVKERKNMQEMLTCKMTFWYFCSSREHCWNCFYSVLLAAAAAAAVSVEMFSV